MKLRLLFTLAWPIIVSRLTQTVISLSDIVFVADLGASAVAATSTGSMNVMTLTILPMGITFVVSSFASQLHGQGDAAGARRYGWYGLGLALLTQILSLATIPWVGSLLTRLPLESQVQHLMTDYVVYRLLSSGAAVGLEALGNYFGGLSRTRPAMVANLFAMALNLLLNWVLIFGRLGMPALGVKGSAIASSISLTASFLGLLVFFGWEGRSLKASPLRMSEFWRLLRFGTPSGFNWFFEFFAFVVFTNVVVAGLGTPVLAALNSVLVLNQLSFMPAFGLASAGSILAGQAIGARQPNKVVGIAHTTLRVTALWQVVVSLLYLSLPALLLKPFAQGADAAALIQFGIGMLRVSAAWQLFDAISMTYSEILRAAGDTTFPLVSRLMVAWLFFVPGAWAHAHFFKLSEIGAMFWIVAYLALLAALMFWRFRSGKWREVKLVEHGVVAQQQLTN
jgi:multidrug resistance protein, MATE family